MKKKYRVTFKSETETTEVVVEATNWDDAWIQAAVIFFGRDYEWDITRVPSDTVVTENLGK